MWRCGLATTWSCEAAVVGKDANNEPVHRAWVQLPLRDARRLDSLLGESRQLLEVPPGRSGVEDREQAIYFDLGAVPTLVAALEAVEEAEP